ncbi:MAG: hypothetical protein J6K99_07225 [Peptococcaceae bacterium]|nr:hypothetical protein [Peptococcaceae bacterium]
MTETMAMLTGYIMGWFSVVAAYQMLRPRSEPQPVSFEPEPEPVQKTPEQMAADREFQQWVAQMNDVLNYDAKGGVKDADKD